MKNKVEKLLVLFDKHPKVVAKMIQDAAGREIYRCELNFDSSINVIELSKALKEGSVAIYTRDYRANEGKIEIDVRSVTYEQLNIIFETVNKLI